MGSELGLDEVLGRNGFLLCITQSTMVLAVCPVEAFSVFWLSSNAGSPCLEAAEGEELAKQQLPKFSPQL